MSVSWSFHLSWPFPSLDAPFQSEGYVWVCRVVCDSRLLGRRPPAQPRCSEAARAREPAVSEAGCEAEGEAEHVGWRIINSFMAL